MVIQNQYTPRIEIFILFYFFSVLEGIREHFLKLTCSIRNDQQYSVICTTPVFYVVAPTCSGSSLPSSDSFLDPSELLDTQIEWVVYHIIRLSGLCAGLPGFGQELR
jgi:hypothetical protein